MIFKFTLDDGKVHSLISCGPIFLIGGKNNAETTGSTRKN